MTFFAMNNRTDPLTETRVTDALRATLTRAGGIAALGLGGLVLLALVSHNPTDPNLFNAVSHAPTNLLGTLGAYGADILLRVFGLGAWVLPLAGLTWGLRLTLLKGADRVIRALLLPLAIPLLCLFAATHVPGPSWGGTGGLGGILGDDLFTRLLPLLGAPETLRWTLLALTLALAIASLWMLAAALGMNRRETRSALSTFARGLRTARIALVVMLGWLAALVMFAFGGLMHLLHRRRAARPVEDDGEVYTTLRHEPGFETGEPAEAAFTAERPHAASAEEEDGRARLMARLTSGLQRLKEAPEPDVFDDEDEADIYAEPAPVRDAIPEHITRVQHPPRREPGLSRKAQAEAQPALALDVPDAAGPYDGPPLSLLATPRRIERGPSSDEALSQNAKMLEAVLDEYGIGGEITAVRPGPVVTMYELEPAAGLKASRVIGLSDDIARSMSALAARVSTVPGRKIIGIELPNDSRETVFLRELLSTRAYGDGQHKLPLALGKDIGGESVIVNLAKMPHLLIAGTTGSGKSVAINTMILSLLYKLSPEECRMIMIDPKMLELSVYDGIPHLLSPVVTDPKKAVVALKWTVAEMEERYRKMSKMGVRNIDGYNSRVEAALQAGEAFTRTVQTGFDDDTGEPVFETEEFAPEKMPYIVVVVDEMADLMMVAGKEIEACIQRLAQMARASGIHLIMATQRPSVDVITGTIKANFPTRISFQVTSKIDSRTILGEQGAEQLLGQGDMLYMANGGRVTRVHGPFCSDEEVEEVVAHLKALGAPQYVSGVVDGPDEEAESDIDLVLGLGGNTNGEDALYDQAVAIVARDRKCSTSYIQRKLAIGYNKAARLVEQMEDEGVVSPANKVGKREILVPERG
ncbi:MAG: DNA translocase FtsK 4TM domain-containing protein [Pseudomonadota bacterium]